MPRGWRGCPASRQIFRPRQGFGGEGKSALERAGRGWFNGLSWGVFSVLSVWRLYPVQSFGWAIRRKWATLDA